MPNDPYAALARQSLETFVRTGKRPEKPDGLPDEMLNGRAGVFVSIKKRGDLRGCIGSISASTPSIADEILEYAVIAGTQDPRFAPVREDELAELTYSVDVLGDAEPAEESGLDAVEYGVIVSSGRRRGLLLPNLEGVDAPRRQIAIALQKAGIDPDEPYQLERFKVVRHT